MIWPLSLIGKLYICSQLIPRFDLSDIGSSQNSGLDGEQKKSMVQQLHQILKPFLLRRLKVDVEHSLPKKREYILNAYLTLEQKKLYDIILEGKLREHVLALELDNVKAQPTPESTYRTTYKYINDGEDIEEVVTEVPFDPNQAASNIPYRLR